MDKKIFSILAIAVFTILLAVALTSAVSNGKGKGFNDCNKNCTKECRLIEMNTHQNCILAHKNGSTQIRQDFKKCIGDLKVDYKNKTINNSEYREKLKKCSKDYVSALKEKDNTRKVCFKESLSALRVCEKKCKEEKCVPVFSTSSKSTTDSDSSGEDSVTSSEGIINGGPVTNSDGKPGYIEEDTNNNPPKEDYPNITPSGPGPTGCESGTMWNADSQTCEACPVGTVAYLSGPVFKCR
jgi:hypothetical protein